MKTPVAAVEKRAKKGECGFEEIGDPGILEAIDRAFEAVTAATVIASADLKRKLRSTPGMEDFEDRGARHRAAEDPANLQPIAMDLITLVS